MRRIAAISVSIIFSFFLCLPCLVFAQDCEVCGLWGPGVWKFPDPYPDRGLQLEVFSNDGVKLMVIFTLQDGPQWKTGLEKKQSPRTMPPWSLYGVAIHQVELKQDGGGNPYFMVGKGRFTLRGGSLFGVAESSQITTKLERSQKWVLGGF